MIFDAKEAATLTPEDEAVIAEELALHERVKEAVRKEALAQGPDMVEGIKSRLLELRDEAITASERDLPALFQQLYTHHSLAARSFEKKLPDMRAPYFARMRLTENGKSRDVLIGYQTFIDTDAGVTIIDWRHATLAKIFFNFKEGDDYEIQLPGRLAQGEMTMRRVLTFEVGELVAVTLTDRSLMRARGGEWRRAGNTSVPTLSGGAGKAVNVNQFGAAMQSRKLPDVSALLDAEQYEILNREDQGALLILGGAGSGKTTIALHRLALLSYRRPRFYHQKAMQVVVPEQGLVRLTQRLLRGLGMDDVKVETFDQWVEDQARHILKGLPRRIYKWTGSAVIAIKRHPAILAAVDRYVELLAERVAERMRFFFGEAGGLVNRFVGDDDMPIMQRLAWFETELQATADASGTEWQKTNLQNLMKEARKTVLNIDAARSELYTNPELHALMIAKGGGQITEGMIGELARHTRKQFEERHGGLDEDDVRNAREVDGAEVEDDDYAGTMDMEDYAVLLYLMLRVHGRVERKTKSVTQYKHLVVDEAQDLAPVELRILGQSLADDGTMTIAGDAVQQSDATVVFRGWDDVMNQLDVGAADEARLTTNYRCPRPVAELGHKVLGPMAPASLPRSVRDGMDVQFSSFPNDGLAFVALTEALSALVDREPLASVAIICENEESAKAMWTGLQSMDKGGDVRLVIDGEFSFKPGIDVTDVSQIKGLEFDYVVIPDANASVYPDTPVARRTMHIAITRAVHQLWVVSVGRRSDILA